MKFSYYMLCYWEANHAIPGEEWVLLLVTIITAFVFGCFDKVSSVKINISFVTVVSDRNNESLNFRAPFWITVHSCHMGMETIQQYKLSWNIPIFFDRSNSFLRARKLTWNRIYCIIRVRWIGSRGEGGGRGQGETNPCRCFNLLQLVSGSLILTTITINVEQAHMFYFLLFGLLAGKCNFISYTKN